MTSPAQMFTAAELAGLLKQHVKTVQRKAKAGTYPHIRLGTEYRFTTEHFEQIVTIGRPAEDTRQARKELRQKLRSRK